MSTATPVTDVMTRLRESTGELHAAAEHHPFQQALVSGRATRAMYASWLAQMYLVHKALDAHLKLLSSQNAVFSRLIRPEQYMGEIVRGDLVALGFAPERVEPLKATTQLMETLERESREHPHRVLGHLYVLEGSKNGNRYIARALAGPLGVRPGGPGMKTLDPHGEQQRDLWSGFKDRMSAEQFTPQQIDAMVDAAKDMFKAIAGISSDLTAANGEPAKA